MQGCLAFAQFSPWALYVLPLCAALKGGEEGQEKEEEEEEKKDEEKDEKEEHEKATEQDAVTSAQDEQQPKHD